MSLFSKENRDALTGPLNLNNPVAVQVLGICSALAVTSQLETRYCDGSFSDSNYGFFECYNFAFA